MNSWTLINLNMEKQDHWMEKSKMEERMEWINSYQQFALVSLN